MSIIGNAITRWRIRNIVKKLRARIGIREFLDGFYEGFNWASTIGVIETGVKNNLLSWEDTGYTRQELECFYREHLRDIEQALYWSFQKESGEVWLLARAAEYGLERFLRFARQNESLKYSQERIISLFQGKIDLLFQRENPT